MKERAEDNWVEPQAEEAVRILEGKGYRIGLLAGSSGNLAERKQAAEPLVLNLR